MAKSHLLGAARIGPNRELKFSLESYWRGDITADELQLTANTIQQQNIQSTADLNFTQVGDFSFYDHVLDTSFLLGNVPKRAQNDDDSRLDNYFKVARGKARNHNNCCTQAGEMTKWFDTNYHYIVPEFDQNTEFSLNPEQLIRQINQAKALGSTVKPVILGPVSYLHLGKSKDQCDKLALLDKLLPIYQELFAVIERHGIEWVQIDEPALVVDLSPEWQLAYRYAFNALKTSSLKILLTTYFGPLGTNLDLVATLPVAGIHLDVTHDIDEASSLVQSQSVDQVLSLGVINGRNIWKSDLTKILDSIEPLAQVKQDNLWLAPSCSLLHVPVTLANETSLADELIDWLAFGQEKIAELECLTLALNKGRNAVVQQLKDNETSLLRRHHSPLVTNQDVQNALSNINTQHLNRISPHVERQAIQQQKLKLPAFPTTTIGSFPQTADIRQTRNQYKRGKIDHAEYVTKMQQEIESVIQYQTDLDLDVLVHGEPERNDMVEYFGELLEGFAQTQLGWVQSYGSRCVKPPILFGDVYRSQPLTTQWAEYAQSLTNKPVKGMLTGPVTILNWSFVRDDQALSTTCYQIALAVKEEVQALEQLGINIIQIDEAALREGLPLRKNDWQHYLDWSVNAFKLCARDVANSTQIHTHMCYSEFDDIIDAIAHMDADVITIESSRSDNELLQTFERFQYPNQIGPGVYDIHSPNIPTLESIQTLIKKATTIFDRDQIWINPDCGLKTRRWEEVKPALENMVKAAKSLRNPSVVIAD
ncbi:5-methyltetrahydropteroyltriglutamate--homocysteine S-methyltransferase [Psychrosphaera sp. 1_MG-2023]|uniref:5-methyltetrahydropteroyltriglutamate-- homocysteine S-methyltransferase n=1 Tax=Psychrosphaera sp. 1_MG-2023 TaxID=3062643 RepID=UPI0026E3E727|nr:5-methyltetrahydropteroyltriglutamate--homocysteine S-methyltransferase [Psychrosphaera sp. 1_MG-2023]MDO6719572.1 5-methyltetrahydropteroyltriglutamate--homocysteine S-methyltransferase [Psychrosphaera sp. 1_MG-2023]